MLQGLLLRIKNDFKRLVEAKLTSYYEESVGSQCLSVGGVRCCILLDVDGSFSVMPVDGSPGVLLGLEKYSVFEELYLAHRKEDSSSHRIKRLGPSIEAISDCSWLSAITLKELQIDLRALAARRPDVLFQTPFIGKEFLQFEFEPEFEMPVIGEDLLQPEFEMPEEEGRFQQRGFPSSRRNLPKGFLFGLGTAIASLTLVGAGLLFGGGWSVLFSGGLALSIAAVLAVGFYASQSKDSRYSSVPAGAGFLVGVGFAAVATGICYVLVAFIPVNLLIFAAGSVLGGGVLGTMIGGAFFGGEDRGIHPGKEPRAVASPRGQWGENYQIVSQQGRKDPTTISHVNPTSSLSDPHLTTNVLSL